MGEEVPDIIIPDEIANVVVAIPKSCLEEAVKQGRDIPAEMTIVEFAETNHGKDILPDTIANYTKAREEHGLSEDVAKTMVLGAFAVKNKDNSIKHDLSAKKKVR